MEHISAELLSATAIVAGLGAGGLIRTWMRYRAGLHLERERSARLAARVAGLAELAGRAGTIRIDERDQDGHRVVEMHGPGRAARRDAA